MINDNGIAVYSWTELNACRDQIKNIKITAVSKNRYFTIASEMKKAQEFCLDHTRDTNFMYKHSEIEQFFNAANNFKYYSSAELRTLRNQAMYSLKYELRKISQMGDKHEVVIGK